MMKGGILSKIRRKIRFQGSCQDGQIAVAIVLFIAVTVLLLAVFLNLARVSQKRISVMNAAVTSSLQAASSLASYSFKLSKEYVGGGVKKCKKSWKAFFAKLINPLSWMQFFLPRSNFLAKFSRAFQYISPVSWIFGENQIDQGMDKTAQSLNRAFRKMTAKQQVVEQAVRQAFTQLVDDPVKVADEHDLDMDGIYGFDAQGKPRDTLSRFLYKYNKRLLWLTASGPAPDGSNYNFPTELQALINNFVSGPLPSFNTSCQQFLNYLGDPRDNYIPDRDDIFYYSGRGGRRRHGGVNTLYRLFAYLYFIDYRELQWRRYPNAELYNLSYHTDASGNVINVWTFGRCYDPDPEDGPPDPDDPAPYPLCVSDPSSPYHFSVNDEIDLLSAGLHDFSDPIGSPEPGFAPELMNRTPTDRYFNFDQWFPNLYHEHSPDDVSDNPLEDFYGDYYDQLYFNGAALDDPESSYLVEKAWYQIIDSWVTRLNAISEDLLERSRVWGGGWGGGQEKWRLLALRARVLEAVNRLNNFKGTIAAFSGDHDDANGRSGAIEIFADDERQLNENPYDGAPGEGSPGDNELDGFLYSSYSPQYFWRDNLGWHSVKVELRDFNIPSLKSYRKRCCKICVKLRNYRGEVKVTVTRSDYADNPVRAPGAPGGMLWKFRYPSISYEAHAGYTYNGTQPNLSSIERKDH